MTRPRRLGVKRPPFTAADVPSLASFARAYLHQDMGREYGSADEAVAAFCRDVNDAERQALAYDVQRLTIVAASWRLNRLADFFQDELRAAWAPESIEDLDRLFAKIQK
jgi:hypothetical protein